MFASATQRILLTCLLSATAAGCGSAITLTVHPTTASAPELVPAPQLTKQTYRKILLLPPEGEVSFDKISSKTVQSKLAPFYTSTLEKVLLGQGFEVISSEVTARAGGKAKGKKAAEKAMILGKETKADAVLLIQTVSAHGRSRYFDVQAAPPVEVEAARVGFDEDDGTPFHKESEVCLHKLDFYELRMEAKLVDSRSGAILWVGSGKRSSTDVIKESWVADFDSDCQATTENFIYSAFLEEEATLIKTATQLATSLVAPLKGPAFEGAAAVAKPKKVAPPPPVKPKVKTAVVSSRRGSLREGPARKSKKLMVVPRKAKVEVKEVMGEWIKVKVQDGTTGWMHESTLIIQD